MEEYQRDLALAVLILVTALALLAVSPWYAEGAAGSADALGPMFWPRVILLIVVAMSIINIGKIYLNRDPDVEQEGAPEDGDAEVMANGADETTASIEEEVQTIEAADETNNGVFIAVIVITGAYIALLDVIGFMILTPIFLITIFWILGYRKPVRSPVAAVLATALLIILFQKIMLIPLPRGTSVFRELSYVVLG